MIIGNNVETNLIVSGSSKASEKNSAVTPSVADLFELVPFPPFPAAHVPTLIYQPPLPSG